MMIKYRRELHQIPELAMQEYETQNYILSKLMSSSFEIEKTECNGILVYKKGKIGNKTIAFRADMDALPIEEKTGLEFASKHNGIMHACGHDGHMTILLGLADYISENDLNENILLIFQPAEEDIGGAEIIVKSKALDKYNIDAIFALHIMPHIKEGTIGIKSGPQMAQATEVDITVVGESSHCALPQQGVDAIYVASQLISQYQSIISKNISPFDNVILNIGKISGGSARNIVCDNVKISGTLRTFDKNTCEIIKDRILNINLGLEKVYGCRIEAVLKDIYPPVINDDKLYTIVKSLIAEDDYEETSPLMTSEDFSYYGAIIPSMFILLGSSSNLYNHPLHNSKFNFDEKILYKGLNLYKKICNYYSSLN